MSVCQAFDVLKRRVVLRGRMRAVSALRVGAAKDASGLGSDLPVLRDARQLPYVPGSSFKGVLRSTVEALVRSVGDQDRTWKADEEPPRLWSCNPLGEKTADSHRGAHTPCLDNAWCEELRKIEGNGESDRVLSMAAIEKHSCTVCALFGSNEMAGRVVVTDMPLINDGEMLQPIEVRDGVAIDRDLLTARDRAKYDFEVVPAGAEFGLEIVLENTTPAQDGLVAAGIGSISEGFARVGGFGTRGLGRVVVDGLTCAETDARKILSGAQPADVEWAAFENAGRKALEQALGGE